MSLGRMSCPNSLMSEVMWCDDMSRAVNVLDCACGGAKADAVPAAAMLRATAKSFMLIPFVIATAEELSLNEASADHAERSMTCFYDVSLMTKLGVWIRRGLMCRGLLCFEKNLTAAVRVISYCQSCLHRPMIDCHVDRGAAPRNPT